MAEFTQTGGVILFPKERSDGTPLESGDTFTFSSDENELPVVESEYTFNATYKTWTALGNLGGGGQLIPCSISDECPDGQICYNGFCVDAQCTQDSECLVGSEWVDGICTPISCLIDSECPDGSMCEDGECVPIQCEIDDDCPVGSECVNGRCEPLTCSIDTDCPEGSMCENGECVPFECDDANPCTDGYCEDNRCVNLPIDGGDFNSGTASNGLDTLGIIQLDGGEFNTPTMESDKQHDPNTDGGDFTNAI